MARGLVNPKAPNKFSFGSGFRKKCSSSQDPKRLSTQYLQSSTPKRTWFGVSRSSKTFFDQHNLAVTPKQGNTSKGCRSGAQNLAVSSILAIILNWKVRQAAIQIPGSSPCALRISITCQNSIGWNAHRACEGRPSRAASIFFMALIILFTTVEHVGLPTCEISFHGVIWLSMKQDHAFFQKLDSA